MNEWYIINPMTDSRGNSIKSGQRLKRIVDGQAADKGYIYKVVLDKWNSSDRTESLIADGGFVRELLFEERSKEFEVVNG